MDVASKELRDEHIRQQAGRANFPRMTAWRTTGQESEEESSSLNPDA